MTLRHAVTLTVTVGFMIASLFIPWRTQYAWMNAVTGERRIENQTLGIFSSYSYEKTPLSIFAAAKNIQTDQTPFLIQGDSYSIFRFVTKRSHGAAPEILRFRPQIQSLWIKGKADNSIIEFLQIMNQASEEQRVLIVDTAINEALK